MRIGQNGRSTVGGSARIHGRSKRLALLILAAVPAVGALTAHRAAAATDTWIGGGADGNWLTTGNWATGTGNAPPVANDILTFGGTINLTTNNNFAANTQFNGITFNSGAGAFTLGGNAVTLGGDINDNSTAIEKITLGLILNGGTDNLNVASGGSLSLGAVTFGNSAGSATVSTFNLNASTSATSLLAQTNSASANVLDIAGSSVLTVNGALTVGFATTTTSPTPNTQFTIAGNELDVNGNVTVGQAETGTSTRTNNTLDLSGLATFKMIATTGSFNAATVQQANGTIDLATSGGATSSNLINAATINLGVTTANSGTGTLNLGAGTNTLEVTTFNIGTGKGNGIIQFESGSGSVTITGLNGTGNANFVLGNQTSATGTSSISTVSLAGHNAIVSAGNITLGSQAGNTGGTGIGNFTFDTGTMSVVNLDMAVDSSGTSANGSRGAFYLGGTSYNPNATGVLNVTTSLVLANNSNATASGTTSGAFIVNGATGNIGSDITVAGTQGTRTTSVVLAGGTLNMQGHAIGSAAAPVTNIGLSLTGQVATLSNLGGAGINGAGLILASNTFTLPATITPTPGSVTYGGGTLILAGTNTYTGNTAANSGTLLVNGTVANTASVNGGILGGTGTINGLVTVNSGSLTGGAGTSGTLNLAGGLTVNGGNLLFNFGPSGSNSINVSGPVTFNSGNFAFSLSGTTTAGTYNVLTSSTPFSAGGLNFVSMTLGRTTFAPVSFAGTSNVLQVVVSGNPASLVWNNSVGGGDGTNWDMTNLNWTSTASSNPNQYFDGDNVTFNDSNNFPTNPNAYGITLNGQVSPGSVLVSTANSYSITGSGSINGNTGLTVTGGGTLTLSTVNSYTGITSVGSGSTLIVSTLANSGTNSNVGASGPIVLDGGTLEWNGNASQSTNRAITITQNGGTLNDSPSASGQSVTYAGSLSFSGSGPRTLTLTGTDASLASQILDGTITDAGGATSLMKSGSGSWTLAAANSFTGGTTINAGRLRLTNGGALGSGSVTINTGGQAYLNIASAFANNFFIAGNGTDTEGAIRLGSSGSSITGTITLNGDARISANGATTSLATISGQITGNHDLELGNGGGTVVNTIALSNVTNNWSGSTTVSYGTVRVGANSGATNGVIPHGTGFGDVSINGGNGGNASIDLNGFNLTINGLNSVTGTESQDFVTNNSTATAGILTVGDNNANGTFGGTIENGGTENTGFAKIGAGTQILTGSNSYSGGTTVGGGTLQMGTGASNALGNSSGNLTVNSGMLDLNGNSLSVGTLGGSGGVISSSTAGSLTLTANSTTNSNFAGSIQDGAATLALTQQGTGTLTLSGANTNSGDTNINSGTLIVTGSLKTTGNVNISGGTILAGTGHVGNVNLNGGTLDAGTATGTVGTLTMNNLAVNGGNLQFDVGSGTADKLVTTGDGVTSGVANFNSGSTITIASSTPDVPAGTYTLLAATNLEAGQPGSSSGTLPTLVTPGGRQTISLDYTTTPNDILLHVGAAVIANLTWNNSVGGGDGTSWDIQSNQNWTSTASVGNPNQFFNGDNVTFNDNNNSSSNPNAYNVSVNAAVAPTSMMVNTANTYNFSGGGSIGGNGSLVKQGTGTLLLGNSGPNTYGGGTAIQNGTLVAVSAGALPIGTALSFGNGSGTTTSTLDLDGNTVTVSSIAENGGTNTIGNSSGGIGTLTYAGSGSSTFGGTVRDGLGGGGSQLALNVNSGSLNFTGPLSFTGNVALGSGATFQVSGAHTESLPGTISGSGNLTVGDGSTATTLTLSAGNSYTGATTISKNSSILGATLANGGTVSTIGAAGVGSSNLVLDGGTLQWTGGANATSTRGFTLTNNGGTLDFSPSTGGVSLTLSGSIAYSGTGPRTLTLTGTDLNTLVIAGQTLSGVLADAGPGQPTSIVKNGDNGWILGSANTYTGGTTINDGRLRASVAGAFGTGPISVANGAEVYINGAGTYPNNISLSGMGITENPAATPNNFNFGAMRIAANGAIIAGTVTLTGNTRITGRSATVAGGTISGQITQTPGTPFNLEFGNSGAVGILTISNTADNWAGNTTISLGTLKAGAASTATTGVIPHGAGFGNVIINGGDTNSADTGLSTLDLNGFNVTINGLSSIVDTAGLLTQDVVSDSGAAATLSVGDNNAAGSFSGIIQNGAGSVGLTKIGSGTQTLGGVNTYTGNTSVNGGTLLLATTGSIASSPVNVGSGSAGTLEIAGNASATAGFLPQTFTSLTIGSTGTINADNAMASASPTTNTNRTVIVTPSLSITSGGKLNLGSNDMIVHSGSSGESVAATIAGQVATGRGSNGAWTGTGITSSVAAASPSNMALAVVLNDTNQSGTLSGTPLISAVSPFNHGLTTFDGQAVADGDVLVKYTYYGDAMLAGSVTAADYTQIDAGFASQGTANPLTGWFNGDFNYDGKINGDDYTLIDNAFNTQGSVSFAGVSAGPAEIIATNTDQIAGVSSSVVPEPGSLTLLTIGAAGLLSRRRRRA
jgi:fibronectin-binding autotransporter adhesin